jgi:pimeloyl-ACP methyl ester carboxylesterase
MVAFAPGGGWTPGSEEQRRLARILRRIRASLYVGGPLAAVLARFGASRRVALGDVLAHPERISATDAQAMIEAAWDCDAFEGILSGLLREPAPGAIGPAPCRMRLVWGTSDRMLPMGRYSDLWRTLLPSAEWVELEGAGHVPMFDDPEGVAKAILEVTATAQRPR